MLPQSGLYTLLLSGGSFDCDTGFSISIYLFNFRPFDVHKSHLDKAAGLL